MRHDATLGSEGAIDAAATDIMTRQNKKVGVRKTGVAHASQAQAAFRLLRARAGRRLLQPLPTRGLPVTCFVFTSLFAVPPQRVGCGVEGHGERLIWEQGRGVSMCRGETRSNRSCARDFCNEAYTVYEGKNPSVVRA